MGADDRRMKPIYIVSGWMRSGTTMMMRCLDAGGIAVVRDPDNPDWEIGRNNYELHNTPEIYEGKAVKSLKVGPMRMRPWGGGYKLIHMKRSARAQQESWIARFGVMKQLEEIERQAQLSLDLAYNRRDTEVLEVSYNDVVDAPLAAMLVVADFLQHPTWDAYRAAEVVDTKLRHWTIEDMPGVEVVSEADEEAFRRMLQMAGTTSG